MAILILRSSFHVDLFAILHCFQVKNISGDLETLLTQDDLTKLKTCSRNFILTATLLRVIEMTTYFDRSLVISQEGSLGRVFQVIKIFIFFKVYSDI